MKSAIEKAWVHGGADFQSRFDKSTAQAPGDERRVATSFVKDNRNEHRRNLDLGIY
jgi:hypothetical protein